MGIYPTTYYYDVNTGERLTVERLARRDAWYEEYDDFSGLRRFRLITAEPHLDIREDCYCCSCGDRPGSDPVCRNHGFAGQRPCEVHNMPGSPWGEEGGDLAGTMPASVQAHLRRGAA